MAHRCTLVVLSLIAVLSGSACEDDSLSELHPSISLCPAAGSPAADCDGTIDVGELPVTLPAAVSVFVVNRGRAALSVSGATVGAPFTIDTGPDVVEVSSGEAIALSVTPSALGDVAATLEVTSDDPERPLASVEVAFRGVEKPSSQIDLCDVDGDGTCGPNIDVDFGTLRRGEERTRAVLVNNIGVVPLHIHEVRLEGESSVAGEMALSSSSQPGVVAPGGYLPVLVTYRPADAGEDRVELVFLSDDEDNAESRARIHGASEQNDPPLAAAVDAQSGLATAVIIVGQQAVLDGTASSDPEGDPLRYLWSLSAPDGAAAALLPAGAAAVGLVPDVVGDYTAVLVVEDSLGQQSAPAEVALVARPEVQLRVRLDWTGGGDLDLHLVASGAPFGAGDCYFGQRQLALGDPALDDDDALLLFDAESAPGQEEAVIAAPISGVYAIYVHAFDGVETIPADATVTVFVEGGAEPVLTQTRQLTAACELWHVGDAVFPEGDVVVSTDAVVEQCP